MSSAPALLALVALTHADGVVTARRLTREAAAELGCDEQDQTRVATAVSELARNAQRYARGGRLVLGVGGEGRDRLVCEVADAGPGMADPEAAARGDAGPGSGLVGVQRLVDAFALRSSPEGTTVTVEKVLPGAAPADLGPLRERLSRRTAADAQEELERQNQELLRALGELRIRQDELLAVNRELDETNRGVVALHHELDQQAGRLRVADERKSTYMAGLSHELRSPLNTIIALTDLLVDTAPPREHGLDEEQLRQVTFIRDLANQQLGLVGDLLDIAKIEAGRVDLDLREVGVEELHALLRAQFRPVAPDEVRLEFEAPPDLPPLVTDQAKVLGVLGNLLANALRHTERGEVRVSAREQDGEVVLEVADTGAGIADEDLDRIFDEFQQVGAPAVRGGRGTGLGLPLARKLAGLLGGELTVASAPGRGSTFSLRLPVRHAGLVPGESPVLVVDDEEPARYVVASLLRPLGWGITEATSGEEALATLQRGVPAAVVLDLELPGMDGDAVLAALRERADCAGVPVVVSSSRALGRAEVAALEALGAEVLDKSRLTSSALVQALGRAAGRVAP